MLTGLLAAVLKVDSLGAKQKQVHQFGHCDELGGESGGLEQNGCIGGAEK